MIELLIELESEIIFINRILTIKIFHPTIEHKFMDQWINGLVD